MARKERGIKSTITEGKGHSFEDFFKRAVNPMMVLRLLTEQPMYVYQMTQEMEKRGGSDCAVSFLYPVLYRLQSLGYVEESGKVISADNRVRNYYAITEEGRIYLEKITAEYREILDAVDKIMDGYPAEEGKCDERRFETVFGNCEKKASRSAKSTTRVLSGFKKENR